jgi:gliding motility-associated-like protein
MFTKFNAEKLIICQNSFACGKFVIHIKLIRPMKKILLLFFSSLLSGNIFSQSTNNCVIPNAGFENGNLVGWTFKSGGYGVQTPCPTGSCPRYGTTWSGGLIGGGINTALNSTSRHTLMTTAGGNDPNATSPAVPVVAPGGGNYSFRLGNSVASASTVPNMADAEAATLSFVVSNQNALFTYMYAFFVNNPGHAFAEQPSFQVVVSDQNNNVLPCGEFFVVAGNNPGCVNSAGFINGNNGYVYQPWTSVSLDLTGYIGQTVSVEFRTADCFPAGSSSSTICSNGTCTLTVNGSSCTYPQGQPPCTPPSTGCSGGPGTHSAYAYIDAYCAPLSVSQPVFCTGASNVQICAPAGYLSYSWPAGQPGLTGNDTTQCVTISNPVPGDTYTVNMISFTGCPTTTTVTLQGFDFALNDTSVCPGSNPFPINLTPSVQGSYTYSWTPAGGLSCVNCQNPVFDPNYGNATYTVTMTDPLGANCSATHTVNITVQQGTSVSGVGASVCSGQNAILTASGSACGGNITYSWTPSTFLSSTTSPTVTAINPTVSITYTVTAFGPNNQNAQTTVPLTVFQIPQLTLTGSDETCFGNNGTVTANIQGNGPYTIQWSNGSNATSLQNLTAGTYSLMVTDVNGCAASAQYVINAVPNITLTANVINHVTCFNGTNGNATATVSGGTPPIVYNWSNGQSAQQLQNVSAGTYTLIATDVNQCSDTQTVTIVAPPLLILTYGMTTPTCSNPLANATANASGGTPQYGFAWSNGQNENSALGLTSGNYTVTVTDANGCQAAQSFSVAVTNTVLATASPGLSTLEEGDSVWVTAGGGPIYEWISGLPDLSCINCDNVWIKPEISGTYCVEVRDTNGCKDTACVRIDLYCRPEFTVPNVFTPNSDQVNELFEIKGKCIKDFSIEIFNRWGTKVFESNEITESWDGTIKGNDKASEGTYYYIIKTIISDNTEIIEKGYVSLFR